MLLPVSVLLSLAAVVVYADDQETCSWSPSIIERVSADFICPEGATCADKWNTVRDWYNGTSCREQRVMVHCKCPGDDPTDPSRGSRQCPIGDEAHALYASSKHSYYLCKPRCNHSLCVTRHSPSMEMVQGSAEFNNYNFYRVMCRCPGQDEPIVASSERFYRATVFYGVRITRTLGRPIVKVQYRCSRRITGVDICPTRRSTP